MKVSKNFRGLATVNSVSENNSRTEVIPGFGNRFSQNENP